MTLPATLKDLHAERCYLSALLWERHDEQRQVVQSSERLEPSDCYGVEHGRILAAVYAIAEAGEDANSITVRELLMRGQAPAGALDLLDELGTEGESRTVGALLEPLPALAKRIRSLARARRAREQIMRALAKVESVNHEAAEEHCREAIGELVDAASRRSGGSIYEAAITATLQIRTASSPGKPSNYTNPRSGYIPIDFACNALPKQTMTIVGGRTGCGKSSLMLGMALDMARTQHHRVGIVSLEDAAVVWGTRALAYVSPINGAEIIDSSHRSDVEREEMVARATLGLRELERVGVELEYALNKPLSDVLSAMRALAAKGCEVIMVDYLQAIEDLPDLGKTYREGVIRALKRLKSLAQSLGVTLVVGSQMSRSEGAKAYAEPHVSELKEAGELENMSEVIVLLWKTSDDENALMLGKVAKVKWSPRRPRFQIELSHTGAIAGVGFYEPPAEEPPSSIARPRFGGRHG